MTEEYQLIRASNRDLETLGNPVSLHRHMLQTRYYKTAVPWNYVSMYVSCMYHVTMKLMYHVSYFSNGSTTEKESRNFT